MPVRSVAIVSRLASGQGAASARIQDKLRRVSTGRTAPVSHSTEPPAQWQPSDERAKDPLKFLANLRLASDQG